MDAAVVLSRYEWELVLQNLLLAQSASGNVVYGAIQTQLDRLPVEQIVDRDQEGAAD